MSDHTAFVSECLEAIPKVNGVKDFCGKKLNMELLTKLAEADPHWAHCFAL